MSRMGRMSRVLLAAPFVFACAFGNETLTLPGGIGTGLSGGDGRKITLVVSKTETAFGSRSADVFPFRFRR